MITFAPYERYTTVCHCGPSSGAGKTTVARGLMSLLLGEGLSVQPFKCGSDYICAVIAE